MKTPALLTLACLSLLTPSLFGQNATPATNTTPTNAPAATPPIPSPSDQFIQAVAAYQSSPSDDTAAAAIKLAVAMDKLPPVPEDARKPFVMGDTMFKNAKSANDFSLAIGEFTEAVKQAPGWPDARYNLAMAKGAAGDYPGAIADLKLYQLFNLPDAEARSVQDKIYAMEAQQQMKASDDAAKASADTANAQAVATAQADADAAKEKTARSDFIRNIQGSWDGGPGFWFSIMQIDDVNVEIKAQYPRNPSKNITISDINITEKSLGFTSHDGLIAEQYQLALDSNGHLVGLETMFMEGTAKDYYLRNGYSPDKYGHINATEQNSTFTRQ